MEQLDGLYDEPLFTETPNNLVCSVKRFGFRQDITLALIFNLVQQKYYRKQKQLRNSYGQNFKIEAGHILKNFDAPAPLLFIDRGGAFKTSHIEMFFEKVEGYMNVLNPIKNPIKSKIYQQSGTFLGMLKTIKDRPTVNIKDHDGNLIAYEASNTLFFDEAKIDKASFDMFKSLGNGELTHTTARGTEHIPTGDVSFYFATNGLLPGNASVQEVMTGLERTVILTERSIQFTDFANAIKAGTIGVTDPYQDHYAYEIAKGIMAMLDNELSELNENDITSIEDIWEKIKSYNISGWKELRAKNKLVELSQAFKLFFGSLSPEVIDMIENFSRNVLFPTYIDVVGGNDPLLESVYVYMAGKYREGKTEFTFYEIQDFIKNTGRSCDQYKDAQRIINLMIKKESVFILGENICLRRVTVL